MLSHIQGRTFHRVKDIMEENPRITVFTSTDEESQLVVFNNTSTFGVWLPRKVLAEILFKGCIND